LVSRRSAADLRSPILHRRDDLVATTTGSSVGPRIAGVDLERVREELRSRRESNSTAEAGGQSMLRPVRLEDVQLGTVVRDILSDTNVVTEESLKWNGSDAVTLIHHTAGRSRRGAAGLSSEE
jgi:hypothetical protein